MYALLTRSGKIGLTPLMTRRSAISLLQTIEILRDTLSLVLLPYRDLGTERTYVYVRLNYTRVRVGMVNTCLTYEPMHAVAAALAWKPATKSSK